MNPAFDQVLAADAETRLGLFNTTAQRLGTTAQNVEKDLWVCWTLDVLFNGLPAGGPRLLFKGGTSLSKVRGPIARFSEDIDVVVVRDDLGQAATVAQLEAMTRTQQVKTLNAIRRAARDYIQGDLARALAERIGDTADRTGLDIQAFRVRPDPDDDQTLLLDYPAVTQADAYVARWVKIESGAKSALDPHSPQTIRPYVDEDLRGADLAVHGVTVVEAERTFWDKVVILHGLRRAFETTGRLRGDGQRVSRHYYDLYKLMSSDVGPRALADPGLGADCVRHARIFFGRPELDLDSARVGQFALVPTGEMRARLQADYAAMAGMIFGTPPRFDAVMASVVELEARLNG